MPSSFSLAFNVNIPCFLFLPVSRSKQCFLFLGDIAFSKLSLPCFSGFVKLQAIKVTSLLLWSIRLNTPTWSCYVQFWLPLYFQVFFHSPYPITFVFIKWSSLHWMLTVAMMLPHPYFYPMAVLMLADPPILTSLPYWYVPDFSRPTVLDDISNVPLLDCSSGSRNRHVFSFFFFHCLDTKTSS